MTKSTRRYYLSAASVLLLIVTACGDDEEQGSEEPSCVVEFADENGDPFESLSEYCFFEGETANHEPADRVFAYDVAAELYADNSRKHRFFALPEGETIGFEESDRWNWPEGATLIKTFYYPVDAGDPDAGEQLLETRLLIKRDGEWDTQSYIWDAEQNDAYLDNTGERVDVEYTDESGAQVELEYRIPNRNDCTNCHVQDGELVPLGPRTRQLGYPYQKAEGEPAQLARFDQLGIFDRELPDLDTLPSVTDPFDEDEPIEDRARSYLDANCAHCHNQDGRAASSALHLDIDITDERSLGICKSPVAAGGAAGDRDYDVVPGFPDESIMIYRMDSNQSGIKMPELPLTTIHRDGVDLVRQWIEEMEPTGCD